jgi:hypothetical protein
MTGFTLRLSSIVADVCLAYQQILIVDNQHASRFNNVPATGARLTQINSGAGQREALAKTTNTCEGFSLAPQQALVRRDVSAWRLVSWNGAIERLLHHL